MFNVELDYNMSAWKKTLIAGLIMYIWGNGAVRGFATMLVVTVVATLVVNVAFSRWLLNQVVNSGMVDDKPDLFGVKKSQIPDVSKGESQFYYGIRGFDYVKNAKYLIFTSLAILAVALVVGIGSSIGGKGFMNLGIDFAAGTKLTITSDSTVTIDEVKSELSELGYSNFTYQAAGDSTVYATTKTSLTVDELKRIFSWKFGKSVPNLFEISRRIAHHQSLPLVDECDSPVKPSHVRICLQAISEYSRQCQGISFHDCRSLETVVFLKRGILALEDTEYRVTLVGEKHFPVRTPADHDPFTFGK